MSRGLGAVQSRVRDALIERGRTDSYVLTPATKHFVAMWRDQVRARWRWYTIDLLGVAGAGSSRGDRVSLRRAVHGLHERGVVQVRSGLPYERRFGAEVDESTDDLVGGVDLGELSDVDPRWPADLHRSLWFRLPPRPARNFDGWDDDQSSVLENRDFGNVFDDFTVDLDRQAAWASEFGQFMRWLFCGYPVCARCSRRVPLAGLGERFCDECGGAL